MNIKAHMICHTHWDREWYLTREVFRTKLVRLIDGLLEVIEEVPEYVSFMLDGQTIAIEDYLEIKPYNKEKLFAALKTGKIICGPWYILPDELLISGESHIRNYIKGGQVVGEVGKKMETAYLPDSFGHPAQMPQIIEGLGMNAMVFWRGVSSAVTKTEFYWESPFSDAKILCIHLPHGYGNSGNLSADMEVTVPRVRELLESLGAKTTADVVLLMNGSDHISGQKDICQIVKQMNKQLQGCQIELSTMEKYMSSLQEKLGELATFSGEFRSGERSMLLGGTLSTRMYLKQRNDCVQNKAERYLEPILALEKLGGHKYDSRGYLDYIWKKILENHPHDSICGCSLDEVHTEMMTRFDCVEQLEDTLLGDAVERNESKEEANCEERKTGVFLFEPTMEGRPSYAEFDICLDEILVQAVNYTKSVIEDYEDEIIHPEMPEGICIVDEQGREIPHVILSTKKEYDTLYQDHTMPEKYKVNKIRVGVLLPGYTFGCHQLYVTPAKQKSDWVTYSEETSIENEYYCLRVENDGFVLKDKRTGKEHTGFADLIDVGDAGDEYTYSWPSQDTQYTCAYEHMKIRKETKKNMAQSLFVNGEFELPEGLSANRMCREEKKVKCPVRMRFTLYEGMNRIDCHMEFENHAKDHRLQIQFPAGVHTDSSEAYHIFALTEHPVEVEIPKQWMEYPQATHPAQGYAGVHDGAEGMSIGTIGLPEYEAVQTEGGTAVNVTLLRCVGWLSRTDLLSRHGNGGWTIETKEAQCLGEHSFDFCVMYHENKTEDAFANIERFRYPAYIQMMRNAHDNQFVNDNLNGLFEKLPAGVQLSAFKPSEDGEGVILRVFSISKQEEQVILPVPENVKALSLVNLAEEKLAEMELNNGKAEFHIKPNQIVSIYMKLPESGTTA